ncbi:hypothetical protein AST00_06550 [Staphylococcus equorum]|uniref:hypothetical protein n=1 Tax=Staphylococcus equorum TaxID=246432 RepID=UPI000853E6E5|nr:hypothetical protein [Staphylococcus equorum]OEK67319.1 hypothetical protein AST00_06550 [Staphylococcus equorum]OEK68576.1 hypothetical protein AST02_08030 [Staphylococcus equorum]
MKKILHLINSIFISFIATLTLLVISFFIMIFSMREGRKTTYFNSIFFEAKENNVRETTLKLGVENIVPIIITFIILVIISFILFTLFDKKRESKNGWKNKKHHII